jgi:hypothetical protein
MQYASDQSNATGKEQQVQLMRTIHGAALHVLIWLGSSSEDSWRATSLVPRLLRAKEAQSAQSDERRYYQLGPEGWQDYGLPDILDPAYPALAALLERAWFTRVWIIQELAVSRQAVVLCGEYQCSWDDFIEAVDHAYKLVVPARWDDTKRIERVY